MNPQKLVQQHPGKTLFTHCEGNTWGLYLVVGDYLVTIIEIVGIPQ